MQRVSVVGNSGSGKSTLARRIAEAIAAPCVELDAIHHLPGWTPMEPGEFMTAVSTVAGEERWVIDGNYRVVVVDGPVWQRADTVVFLDLPRRVVMRQVILRSLRRVVTREELWNGNRERLGDLLSMDPERSIVVWAWRNHAKYRERYGSAATLPECAHLRFVRLRSHAEATRWLTDLRTNT